MRPRRARGTRSLSVAETRVFCKTKTCTFSLSGLPLAPRQQGLYIYRCTRKGSLRRKTRGKEVSGNNPSRDEWRGIRRAERSRLCRATRQLGVAHLCGAHALHLLSLIYICCICIYILNRNFKLDYIKTSN